MATFDLPLDQIDAARLAALVADAAREGRQLEYKEQLPGSTDDDKREFLSDATSFANAAGGDILYGIRERRDAQGNATGEPDMVIGLPGLNVNVEQLRLENLLRDGVAPRMPRVTFREIHRGSDPPCLLLRIGRSWAGLHMVTFRNLSRFYSRNAAGKYPLDVGEIRAGFLAAETAYEPVRRFRLERISRLFGGESPIPLGDGPKVLLHALPLSTSEDPWQRFSDTRESDVPPLLPPLGGPANSWRFNLDGFVTYTIRSEPARDAYAQLFRNGGIEAVSGSLITFDERRGGGFYGFHIERAVIRALKAYHRCWAHLVVEPPLVVGLTLSGVRGKKLIPGADWFRDEEVPFDRDPLLIPEIIMEDLSAPVETVLQPLFDLMWNAGGWRRSPYYDEHGQRQEPSN